MNSVKYNQVSEAMTAAVVKTFSDMAFIDVMPATDISEDLKYSHILQISILEPEKGSVALYLPVDCKRMIVENVYGIDWDELLPAEIDDCLLEILNVLAGNFLSEYCGIGVKHNISLPELFFDSSEVENNDRNIKIFFDAEGTPFHATVALK